MKLTRIRVKIKNKPVTVREKKKKLEEINPALNQLIETFQLNIKL